MKTRTELLIKILTSKEFNDYGFFVNFELNIDAISTKKMFNVKFKNPNKKSWTLTSLEEISILIIGGLCKHLSIDNFNFPKNFGIKNIFMDGELLSDKEDYFLSQKVKNDLKNYFNSLDLLEDFPTNKGEIIVRVTPYKYKLKSYRSESNIGFEIFFKLTSFMLNDKEIKITDKNLLSYIAGYFNFNTAENNEDDIAGDIYGILEDELNFQYTDSYVNSYLIVDRNIDNKKIDAEMVFDDKEEIGYLFDEYFSKK